MSFFRVTSAIALILLQSNCATRLYNVAGERSAPVIREKVLRPVNQSPRNAAGRILLRSGIAGYYGGGRPPVSLVVDQAPAGSAPLRPWTAYSAGLVPQKTPAQRVFRLTGRASGRLDSKEYDVRYVEKRSAWERFKFFHDDEKVLSRALAWSYVRNGPPPWKNAVSSDTTSR